MQDFTAIKERLADRTFLVKMGSEKYRIFFEVSRYHADFTVALQAFHTAEEGFCEPFGRLTVCLANHKIVKVLGPDEILVKTWSENEEWTACLLKDYPTYFERRLGGFKTDLAAEVWAIKGIVTHKE